MQKDWKTSKKNLTVTLTIMISALVLTHSSAARVAPRGQPLQAALDHRLHHRHQNDLLEPRASRIFTQNMKKSRRVGNLRQTRYLRHVVIKLENVIDKYDLKKSDLSALYEGVVGCGLDKCEKFPGVIPENQALKDFTCVRRRFKKKVLNLLSHFHKGVQQIKKCFQVIINFEKWPYWTSDNRLKLLKELKTDIKLLNLEIETVLTDKGGIVGRQPKIVQSSFLSPPKSYTDLKIYEWRIIQGSEKFLRDWEENLHRVIRCWKRRKQKAM